MPQGTPAAGQHRESAFTETAQAAQQGVVGARVDVEYLTVRRLLDRREHADARSVVPVGKDALTWPYPIKRPGRGVGGLALPGDRMFALEMLGIPDVVLAENVIRAGQEGIAVHGANAAQSLLLSNPQAIPR